MWLLTKKKCIQYPTERRNEKQYTRSVYNADDLRVFSWGGPVWFFTTPYDTQYENARRQSFHSGKWLLRGASRYNNSNNNNNISCRRRRRFFIIMFFFLSFSFIPSPPPSDGLRHFRHVSSIPAGAQPSPPRIFLIQSYCARTHSATRYTSSPYWFRWRRCRNDLKKFFRFNRTRQFFFFTTILTYNYFLVFFYFLRTD